MIIKEEHIRFKRIKTGGCVCVIYQGYQVYETGRNVDRADRIRKDFIADCILGYARVYSYQKKGPLA